MYNITWSEKEDMVIRECVHKYSSLSYMDIAGKIEGHPDLPTRTKGAIYQRIMYLKSLNRL